MNLKEYFDLKRKTAAYIVEKGRKIIYKNEFKGCTLSSFKIPNSVEIIEEGAFENSKNLIFVYFEKGSKIKEIGEQAFFNCGNLDNLDLPSSLTKIGFNCFGATSLSQRISVYDGVKYIGTYSNPYLMVYESCYLNKAIKLHNKTRFILNSAFLEDEKLIELSINKSLIQIGEYAFEDCLNLRTIKFRYGFSLTKILEDAFKGCVLLNELKVNKVKHTINNKTIYSVLEFIQ